MKKLLLIFTLLFSMDAFALFENQIYVSGLSTANTAAAALANKNIIQNAVNQGLTVSSTVNILNQNAYIDGVAGDKGILVPSNTKINLNKTTLKVFTNASTTYSIFRVSGVSNVVIQGDATSKLIGDRATHTGSGVYGMGVSIKNSIGVTLSGFTISEMMGDGVYIGGADNTTIRVQYMTLDHNRRQGMSVIAVNGFIVTASKFINTADGDPALGIDLEPNSPTELIRNVQIASNTFINNQGGGLKAYTASYLDNNYYNVLINNNSFDETNAAIIFSNSRNIIAKYNTMTVAQNCVTMVGSTNSQVFNNTCIRKTPGGTALYAPIIATRPNTGNSFTTNILTNYSAVASPASIPSSQITISGNTLN
jgi:Right handed beta helix region